MNSFLYKSNIIEHYKAQHNISTISVITHKSEVKNTSCGDEIELFVNIVDDVVIEIQHVTRGCAICMASMSMLSEYILGKKLEELKNLDNTVVLEMLGMKEGSGREKCAVLSVEGVRKLNLLS